ncbi:MFS transporter [Candidatus Bathyarchaeota archaeon]|nr:MFS transporter [Candidatus Bathyarchaeota archaeon]
MEIKKTQAKKDDFVFDKRLYVVFLIVFTEVLGFSIAWPVVPALGKDLGLTELEIGLILSVFSFCQLFASPITGKLSDRFGRKPLLILSQISTFAGFLMLGFATSAYFLLAARIIDGLLGSNMTVSQAYISDITLPTYRTRVFGYFSGVFGAAFIFGPVIGGILAEISYSVPMFFAAGIVLISIFLVIFFLPETVTKKPKKVSVSFNDVFPVRETKEFVKISKVRNILIMFFIYNLGFFLLISNFTLFMQAQFGIDVGLIGVYLGWFGLLRVIIQTLLIVRLLKALGEESMLKTGIIAMIISMIGLAFSPDYMFVFIPLIFLAYGTGVVRPVITSRLTNSVTEKKTATLLGVNNSLNSIAQIITPIVGGFMIQYLPSQTLPLVSVLFFLVMFFLSRNKNTE